MHPDYREKVQANVDVKGGVLVLPGTAPSVEAWLEEARAVEAEHETEADETIGRDTASPRERPGPRI
jgi:hypothetical protein